MTGSNTGIIYDAAPILGLGEAISHSLPDPAPGEIVIAYGGWPLQKLRDSDVGKWLMYQDDWYDKYAWSTQGLPSGIYRLRIPVSGSNRKNFAEQERMLPAGEAIAPVVLVATALLAHYSACSKDLLKNHWTRCREQTAGGYRVVLAWDDGHLGVVDRWDASRRDKILSSSIRIS
jgi:hypothetical protein